MSDDCDHTSLFGTVDSCICTVRLCSVSVLADGYIIDQVMVHTFVTATFIDPHTEYMRKGH